MVDKMEVNNMKKLLKVIVVGAVVGMICLSMAGCGVYECERCGETFTGDAYYADLAASSTVCRDCAQSYWAPLNVENFKK